MAENTKNKISIATYGIGDKLDKESSFVADVVKQTSIEVANLFGKRVDNKVIDTYTNLNLSNLFTVDKKPKKSQGVNSAEKFKELMQDNSMSAVNLLSSEQGRIVNYSNYKSIVENIPECAFALETYISNILSPDDYNKNIFDINYVSENTTDAENVKSSVKKLIKKYKLEDKTETIIRKTLTYGDCFVSVLPYDKEISKYLAQTTAGGLLNESISSKGLDLLEETYHITERTYSETLTESMVSSLMTSEEKEVLLEAFGAETDVDNIVSNIINTNVKVRTVTDLLRNKAMADNDIIFSKSDIDDKHGKAKRNTNKFTANALAINGADVRILEADKIVPLEIDDVCYGYYYVEPGFTNNLEQPYNAMNARGYTQTANPMNPSIQPQPSGTEGDSASTATAKFFNISDEKLSLISNILLKAIGKKLNKEYINENKQFKELLFSLLKQKYLFEKGVSITYFLPEEIIHFKTPSIFKDIVFFAKIYLAILTNTVIIKMGRGHDKRIYYIESGVDTNQEQAIMKVVQDVKTKEFKMSNLGSISSILSLNPGAFDDYYMPVSNGTRPVDIETLQGMDQDISSDFIQFIKKSMIEGTGLPSALLEMADNIEFARQISSQNANFCRKVVRLQKMFTEPFGTLVRQLYVYDNQYTSDNKKNIMDDVDINEIVVNFPSPAALNMSNIIETLTQVDSFADYVTKRYVPDRMDQSSADEQQAFKMAVIESKTPQIEWEVYKNLYEKFKDKYEVEKLAEKASTPPQDPNDPYGGGQSY